MSVEAPAVAATIASAPASLAEGVSSAASLSIASVSEGVSSAPLSGLSGVESMTLGIETAGMPTALGEVQASIATQAEIATIQVQDATALAQTREALEAIKNGLSDASIGLESTPTVDETPTLTEQAVENTQEASSDNVAAEEPTQEGDIAKDTKTGDDQKGQEEAENATQEGLEDNSEQNDTDNEKEENNQDEKDDREDEEEKTNKNEEKEKEDKEDDKEEEEDKKDPEKPIIVPVVSLDKLSRRIQAIGSSISRRAQTGLVFASDVADDFMSVASQDASLQSDLRGIPANTGEPNQTVPSYGQDKTLRAIGTEIAKVGFGSPQEIFNAAVHANQKFAPVDMRTQGSGPQASEEQVAQVTGGVGVSTNLRRAA